MIPQLIGTAIHTSSQNTVVTMFSATSCEPAKPAAISRAVTSQATRLRSGAAGRGGMGSRRWSAPLAATAVGSTTRKETNTTAAPPMMNSQSGTGRS